MKSEQKRGALIGIIVMVVLLAIFGVSFAFYNYSRTSENQLLVTGDIYMKYQETNDLNITNALPREEYIPNEYFEFTVEGINKSNQDIWYEIILNHGDDFESRTTRIADTLLLFRLVEVKDANEEVIFDRMSYQDLNNRRIWVDTIVGNTTNDFKKTYRLYMWISPLTLIGNMEHVDYDLETWNKQVYASIKVTVAGDFTKKEPDSCFSGVKSATYNVDRTEEQVAACVEIFSDVAFKDWFTSSESPSAYCNGTGTSNGSPMTEDAKHSSNFNGYKDKLIEIGIIKENPIDNSIIGGYSDTCSKKLVIPSVINKNKVTILGDNAFRNKKLTSINMPSSLEEIGYDTFSENELTEVKISNNITTIGIGAFFKNKLTNIYIPDSVKYIGEFAFSGNLLTNINLSDGVTVIGKSAFLGNKLTNISIPDSVETIDSQAFAANDLRSVIVGSGITYIGDAAFAKNIYILDSNIRNKDLESITINKTCDEIKTITSANGSQNKYYPWLGGEEIYKKGTTIYGIDNALCDTY